MLHFEKLGTDSKPACVFLHAFPLDSEMWHPQIEALSALDLQVILIDLPGFGKSYSVERLSMEIIATEVVKVIDALKIKKASFVGLSMGGYVIFNLYRLFPEKISALALCDTTPAADSEERKQLRFELIEQISLRGTEVLVEQMLPNLVSTQTLHSNPLLIEWLKKKFLNAKPQAVISALKAMAERRDHFELLPKINVPTLLIFGEEDKATNLEIAEKINSSIPNSSLKKIKNAGHYSNLENPEDFNSALVEFIKKNLET
jgi:3-oxoadipate enol-lactonase